MSAEHKIPEALPVSPFPAVEENIAAYWERERIFARSIEERPENKGYVFYDGPPFATGLPHYGHLLQSALKDAVPRYWTMRGYRVPRVWGWDCHGLPIENEIEKALKLGSKRAIEDYGIDKFNAACRASVFVLEHEWDRYIKRLGRWVDFEHSYKTLNNDYIESVWWVFSELHKKGYIYKDRRVSLYCPRCATPLSHHEIAMEDCYVEREDPALFVKFPVKGKDKTYFLAWTTTPWTLPANTGLAVHPDLMYLAVKLEASGETLIFAEAREQEVLRAFYPLPKEGAPFQIVERWMGSEMVGMRYEPLYSFMPVEGDGFRVVAAAHVTADDGTGIVHTAPAFGEDDFSLYRTQGLPLLETVDVEGKLKTEMGQFAGQRVKDADPLIVADLQQRGLLFRSERITHSVATCYRCHSLLMFRAQPAWFVNITKLKPKLLKTADKIVWYPETFKTGRFGKGLETAPDWNISRTRYWGSPLPVWECASCSERTIVGSVAELKKLAKTALAETELDLHRTQMDQVIIPCSCGGEQRRVTEVFDCWFESGSMPVASVHYPFANRRWFENNFPADFIAEGQDQTRGWFYALHVIATALFNKPAFKNVIVTGLIMAEDGKKMSKSLKNFPDPWHLLTTYGADALRYYLLSSTLVEAEALNFSERDMQSIVRGFLNLIWNVKAFYTTYAGTEDVKLVKPRSAHVLDRWLFARLASLTRDVTEAMDKYHIVRATRPLREFVDDLSTWWLRRSRDRMKSDDGYDKLDALRTLKEALLELSKIMAPFTPFLAERLYLDLGGLKSSVHLEKWPKADVRLIDEHLLEDIRLVREIASRGHEARAVAKIPVRQALAAVQVHLTQEAALGRLQRQVDLLNILKDELNVERVDLSLASDSVEPLTVTLDTEITPALRAKGLRREFVRHVMNLRKRAGLQPTDRINLRYATDSEELQHAIAAAQVELMAEMRADEFELQTVAVENAKHQEQVTVSGTAVTIAFV